MALIVWLPLNKDNSNQGLLDLNPTNQGTVSFINDGKLGKCLSAGNGSQVTNGISYNSNLVSDLGNEYSAAIWVRPLGNHVHYNGTFVSSGNWNGKCWSFGVSQNNSQVDVFCSKYNIYITCEVPTNTWTHLASVCKDGVVKLYKNGEYVGQRATTTTLDSDANNFTVGRETYAGGYFSFNGNINDVRIYNHALSSKEIKEISKGLICHYTLDNNGQGDDDTYTDTIVYDTSGNGHNGTITGTLTYNSDTPRYSLSTKFTDGRTNYISTPITLGDSKNITINLWIKSTDGSVGYGNYHIPLSISGNNFEISIPTTGKFRNGFVISGTRYVGDYGTVNCLDKNWHMLTATYDGSNIKRYIDGELVNTTAISGTLATGDKTLVLGNFNSTSYGDKNILKSDVRIYTTALSQEDILELYKNGASIDKDKHFFSYEYIEPNNSELLVRPWTNAYSQKNLTPNTEYTLKNDDGEYCFEGGSTSAGSEYIYINPTGHTYYYDMLISVSAGNQFYIGFERYDANKTARSNQACVYILSTKPSTDIVKQRYRGTVNLSTDGVNPLDSFSLRVLNGWTGSASTSTKTATIHYLSLREITTDIGFETSSISKQGVTKTDMLVEYNNTINIEKTGLINATQFIEY